MQRQRQLQLHFRAGVHLFLALRGNARVDRCVSLLREIVRVANYARLWTLSLMADALVLVYVQQGTACSMQKHCDADVHKLSLEICKSLNGLATLHVGGAGHIGIDSTHLELGLAQEEQQHFKHRKGWRRSVCCTNTTTNGSNQSATLSTDGVCTIENY